MVDLVVALSLAHVLVEVEGVYVVEDLYLEVLAD